LVCLFLREKEQTDMALTTLILGFFAACGIALLAGVFLAGVLIIYDGFKKGIKQD
jgi:cbb3-type cytochrome oxidase subunit 3